MGTTRDAFLAGSTSFVLVATIEGYDRLLYQGNTAAAALTAYAGTDWTLASAGLTVDLKIDQSLSPDEPFPRMGTCNLWIVPTPGDDNVGVAFARKRSPYQSYLDATLTNESTTVTIKSTVGLSNGDRIHIGTECIQVGTVASATSLTGCTRGKFSPFGSYADSLTSYASRNFSHYHRVGTDAQSINSAPRVTSTPRVWHGRWVAVRAHRVVNGVLDTLAESELLFAGKILDTRDDPNTFATVISVKGASEVFAEAIVGSAQWEGFASDGVYLYAGQVFNFFDFTGTAGRRDATTLTVVASGASGANQINQGYHALTPLCSALSAWIAASTMNGAYSFQSPVTSPLGLRTKIYWSLTSSLGCAWGFSMPKAVSVFFGFTSAHTDPTNAANVVTHPGSIGNGGTLRHHLSDAEPQRVAVFTDGGPAARAKFTTKSGDLADQYASLPASVKPPVSLSEKWGLFAIGDNKIVRAAFTDNLDGTADLFWIQSVFVGGAIGESLTLPASQDVLACRQIYAFETDPVILVNALATSVGPTSYNTPLMTMPAGCGAGIPYELVDGMITSFTKIPMMGGSLAVILEKPTRMSDLIKSDFVFRWSFLFWKDGGIECGSWKTPTTAQATYTLNDGNKAVSSSNNENHRTPTQESSEWLRQVVKIRYNRDATDPRGEAYKSLVQFANRDAIDEAGGASTVVTISLRNTYSEFAGTGQSIESLLDGHFVLAAMVSKVAKRAMRSIGSKAFFAIGLGDIALFTDTFARDPETGLRSLTARPTLITRMWYSLGGSLAGQDDSQPIGGGVDLFFTDTNPDKHGAAYVPSADINENWTFGTFTAGYSSSTSEIATLANRYSETTEGVDAESFPIGAKIRIIERDPADPTAPVYWDRIVASQGGVYIGLTAALSSPAYDATKRYHVIFQDYDDVLTSQRVKTFQADRTDGLILDATQPYYYGSGGADSTFTTNAAIATAYGANTTAVEMVPSLIRIDSAGRDVAHEAALIRLLDNLIDYKLTVQGPHLSNTVLSNTTVTGTGYLLVSYFPIYLTSEVLSNAVYRLLTVAPWAYSTDGTATKIRVTLSRERPSFPTTANVAWAGTFAQYEWTGITSTTPGTLADGTLTANVKNPSTGEAWIAIECGFKCATRRLAKLILGARVAA